MSDPDTLDPPGTAGLRRRLDVTCGARWREGNVVALLEDRDAAARAAVEAARSSLLVVLGAGWPRPLREELALACGTQARAGVTCRALVAPGALDAPYLERLERSGCEVDLLERGAVHATPTFVVVDAVRAVLPTCSVEGPTVRDLVATFQGHWSLELLPGALMPALDASGHAHAALVHDNARVARARELVREAARRGVAEPIPGILVADQALLLVTLAPGAALLVDDRRLASDSRHFSQS